MMFPDWVKRFVKEDLENLLEYVNDQLGVDAEVYGIDYWADLTEQDPYEKAIDCIATAEIRFGHNPRYQIEFPMEYFVGDDECFMEGDEEQWKDALRWRIEEKVDAVEVDDVKASTSVKKQAITAADNDFDDLMEEDDGIEDAVDDLADDVEDMQDSLDDVTEDDPNIDVDNNITNHYIAECDKCKGIFISAVVESDQEVEKITGVCPLCQKESEQFLRWVVHEVE